MYLKSIEVYGFKSFANKILFKFENGITGIVGPNGSGKSNVADAVRWVLGEQSAKQLRGAKMEDVIFAGTEMRKPHGSAYVAITLDNSDHVLPIDYEEVTVARRVYRSGESEYLINGTPCRLKDINNMFFDTGIGKEGYSIIGQGQVEKILSGKPEDRRELFDEAAGIVKYKKNKAATEKALESERQNLYRVNDILSELEKQVGPLEKQAETAKRYLLYKEEMKKLDVNVFLLDSDRIQTAMKEGRDKLAIVTSRTAELNQQYESIRAEYDRLETELEQYNQKIDIGKTQITELKLAVERAEGEVRVLNQKIDSVRLTDEHVGEQIRRVQDALLKQTEEQRAYQAKKAVLDERLDTADDVVEEAKARAQEIQDEITRLEENIEKNKADIIDLMNENSSMKGKVARYDTLLENIGYRKTQINQRYGLFKTYEMADQEQYKTLQEELQTLDEEVAKRQEALTICDHRLDENTAGTRENREKLSTLRNAYTSAKAKAESLRNITERYDGYGNSIRRVMEQKERDPGIIGVVADIISVPKKYEIAIETALGGSIQNIVTKDELTAKRLIQYLKQNKFGRATFLPLTAIRGNAELILKDGNREATALHAEHIRQSAERMGALMENLLDYYRIDNGKETVRVKPFRLAGVAETLETEFAARMEEKRLEFRVNNAADEVVMGDRNLILRIGSNLLSNALKFTERGGVTLTALYAGGKFTLAVEDSGGGIDKDKREQIFKPFERLSNAATQDGFGLGLSIVKSLAELMEGSISVENIRNTGSRFSVVLPLPQAEKAGETDRKAAARRTRLGGCSVLSLDNDSIILGMIHDIFVQNGVHCDTCTSTGEMAEKLREGHYDLLTTDLKMQDASGYEVLELLRTSDIGNSRTIPVMVVTGSKSITKEELTGAGFGSVLYKPFSIDELLAAAEECIGEDSTPRIDLGPLFAYGDKRQRLECLVRETEKEMAAIREEAERCDRDRLDYWIHHIRSSWMLIHAEGPLQELYDVLHGNGTAEEIREYAGKVTGQGETIIRLARKEMDRTVWEE